MNFSEFGDKEVQEENCIRYLTVLFLVAPQRSKFILATTFCRFIYVRHASKLLQPGVKLLHWLTLLLLGTWTCHSFLITPFSLYIKKDRFLGLVKGQFCARINISTSLNEEYQTFSVRPKVQIAIASFCFVTIQCFLYFAAKRASKHHKIVNRRHNLVTNNLQFFYFLTVIAAHILDQMLNAFLETYYNDFGTEEVFKIWVAFWILANFGKLFFWIYQCSL